MAQDLLLTAEVREKSNLLLRENFTLAKMYPANGYDKECRSPAERDLYACFKTQLDERFTVIHSAWWHSEDEQGRPEDGEADFILIHPDYGILVLEVKGGIIERKNRNWFQTNRSTLIKQQIGDPARQAKKSAKVLARIIRRNPRLHALKDCPIGFSVWFPDVDWKEKDIDTLEGQQYFLLDRSNKDNPQRRLAEIFYHFRGAHNPPVIDKLGVQLLLQIIEQSDELFSSFGHIVLLDGKFSEMQFAKFLETWQGNRQTVIQGCAGSGKTVLALEVATRLAIEGYKILFLVKSPHMATWLRSVIDSDQRGNKAIFELNDLESLSRLLAQRGGKLLHLSEKIDINTTTGQQQLRTLFHANIESIEQQDSSFFFDGIVVDDAEDFEQPLSGEIQKLRRDRRNGFYYVFKDEVQRMTELDRWSWQFIAPNKPLKVSLTENWRNSRAVFEMMKRFYPTLERNPHFQVKGGTVLFYEELASTSGFTAPFQSPEALRQALEWLWQRELSSDQILVITMRGREASYWNLAANRRQITAPFPLRWFEKEDKPHLRKGTVGLTTINLAKGLESEAVILVELDGLDGRTKKNIRHTLSYVGISRARQHLIILGSKDQLLSSVPLSL